MIERSIFPIFSLDRNKIHWEDYIGELTPIDTAGTLRVKREDCFAPLGYGGVNGGKVRQLLWVLTRYMQTAVTPKGILMAGSVKSPLLARVPVVARHLGLPCHLVIGADPVKSAMKNESVKIATRMGATFSQSKVAYNPALQRMVRQLHEQEMFRNYYLMEYGLSIGGTSERIHDFYKFGAEQVRNIPDDIETLLLPAGSCNTLISVLYGLALYQPARVREIVLFGIGPNRIAWYEERLKIIESVSGIPLSDLFARDYMHNRELQEQFGNGTSGKYKLRHYDLHTTKFAGWGNEMPANLNGLELHPLYEGKIWNYMQRNRAEFSNILESGHALLWMVGGPAKCSAMEPAMTEAV
jgi:hypothetical protein